MASNFTPPRALDPRFEPGTLATIICLAIIFILSSVVRIALTDMVPAPYIFNDELIHLWLARSLWAGNGTWLGEVFVNFPCWLYPLSLAPWIGRLPIEDALDGIRAMNAVMVSTTIFFSYGLTREVASRRRSLAAAVLTALLPGFGYSPTVMSESMFLPIFTLALWMGFRAIDHPTWTRRIAAGFVMGLAFHVKPQGLYLPIIFAIATIVFEIARVIWSREGVRFMDALKRITAHWLTAFAWGLALAPRLAALKWIEGMNEPFHLQTFLGSYYKISAGVYSEGGGQGLIMTLLCSLSVMITGVAFLPLLTLASGWRDRDSLVANRKKFLLIVLASIAALGTVALTVWMIRGVRIHERYFMVAYPGVLAAFCAFTPRSGAGARICIPFVIWGFAEVAFFRFVQTPTVLNEWYVWTDSPTFSGLRILTHPHSVGFLRIGLVSIVSGVAVLLAVFAGRDAVRRIIAVGAMLFAYSLAWYIQHDRVTASGLRVESKIGRTILKQIPDGHKVIVLLDGLNPETANRALFHSESQATFLNDQHAEWYSQKLILDDSGQILLPEVNATTWLLTSDKFSMNLQPVEAMENCNLYRIDSARGRLRFTSKVPTEDPEIQLSE